MKKKIQQPKEYSRIRRKVSFDDQNNQQNSATVVYKDKRRGFVLHSGARLEQYVPISLVQPTHVLKSPRLRGTKKP